MPPRTPAVEHAMEAQAALHTLRRLCAPLWAAAMASGDWILMSDRHALADRLRADGRQLRRITGELEAIECPDGLAAAGHGRAA